MARASSESARRSLSTPVAASDAEPPAAAADSPPETAARPPVEPAGYVIATATLRAAGGAVAHRPGDRVPAQNVARNGWTGLVRPPGDGQ